MRLNAQPSSAVLVHDNFFVIHESFIRCTRTLIYTIITKDRGGAEPAIACLDDFPIRCVFSTHVKYCGVTKSGARAGQGLIILVSPGIVFNNRAAAAGASVLTRTFLMLPRAPTHSSCPPFPFSQLHSWLGQSCRICLRLSW